MRTTKSGYRFEGLFSIYKENFSRKVVFIFNVSVIIL